MEFCVQIRPGRLYHGEKKRGEDLMKRSHLKKGLIDGPREIEEKGELGGLFNKGVGKRVTVWS